MSEGRAAGIRFSVLDGVAISVCALLTWALRERAGSFAWVPAIALGHFFLFCNVFRVRRRFELAWAAAFLMNFCGWYWAGFSWLGVLALQTPATLLAIGAEMRSSRYHGIWSGRINPPLTACRARGPGRPPDGRRRTHGTPSADGS